MHTIFALIALVSTYDVAWITEPGEGGEPTLPVTWTYDVIFMDSDIKWASRWDIYLTMGHRNENQVRIVANTNVALASCTA